MLAYLEILRPANALMSVVAVFIGGLLVAGGASLFAAPQIYIAVIAAFLVTGGGNVINDYIDVDSDRINKPRRPIPSGRMDQGTALAYAIFLFCIGILLSLAINFAAFIIVLVNVVLLILYSFDVQDRLFLGNLVISYLVGSTFLFGGAALGNPLLPLMLTLIALLANMSREIIKDLEDIEGDRLAFLKKLTARAKASVAQRFGMKGRRADLRYSREAFITLAAASMIAAIAISPLPFLWGLLGKGYLALLVPSDMVFFYAIAQMGRAKGRKSYARISKTIKAGMFISLLAFIAGIIV